MIVVFPDYTPLLFLVVVVAVEGMFDGVAVHG